MDTTILRIIIAAIGVAVVLGIYLWDYFRRKRKAAARSPVDTAEYLSDSGSLGDGPEHSEFLDVLEPESASVLTKPPPIKADELLSLNPAQETEVVTPASIATADVNDVNIEMAVPEVDVSPAVDTRIILLSLVPKDAAYFSGDALLEALTGIGLEYGEKGVFHRFHEKNGSKYEIFSVASLVEPGTFPIGDMSSFQCPGITLFLQTDAVPDALEAFDDLTDTGHDLVFRLFGKLLDANRKEVTMADFIEPIRDSLSAQSSNNR